MDNLWNGDFFQDWSENGEVATETVALWLQQQQTALISDMQPVTWNIRDVFVPTQDLFTTALGLISREYGDVEITSIQGGWLYNDIITGFNRLMQLLVLERPVSLDQIILAYYSENRYTAGSDTRISEFEESVATQSNADSTYTGTNTGQVSQNNSMNSQSQGTTYQDYSSNARNNSDTNYRSDNTSNSDTDTSNSQVTSTSSNFNYLFPRQATTTGNAQTSNFPVVNSVRSLQAAFADSAQSGDNRVDATSNNSTYTSTGSSSGNNAVVSTSDSIVDNTTTDSGTMSQQVNNIQNNVNDTNNTTTTTGDTESSNEGIRRDSAKRATGQRIRGYDTNTNFASQLLAWQKLLMESPVAFDWWLDRFNWLRGIY